MSGARSYRTRAADRSRQRPRLLVGPATARWYGRSGARAAAFCHAHSPTCPIRSRRSALLTCREESTFCTMIGVTPANDGEGRTVSRDSYNSWSIHTFGSQ
jgi:hypothetical protein